MLVFTYFIHGKTKNVIVVGLDHIHNIFFCFRNAYSDSESVPNKNSSVISPKQPTKREEGWREVVRK